MIKIISSRMATSKRKRRKRSRHRRCPSCKKLRKWWMRANEWHEGRTRWGYVNGKKACWLCIKRSEEKIEPNETEGKIK